jgi:hypothetical protein
MANAGGRKPGRSKALNEKLAKDGEKILDKYEVMEILHICERTLNSRIKEGYLPYSSIVKKRYFLWSDLLEMLAKFKVKGGKK